MVERLVSVGLQYLVYSLEVGLVGLVLVRRYWRRLTGLSLYLALLLATDGIGRPYVLYKYGFATRTYAYFFWLTDVALTLGAFVLVCAFFRRACAQEAKMWRFLRLLLLSVFILVLGISSFSLFQNYRNLFTNFIVEFQQNLYFTCLVLNTLLYILMQQIESVDDELTFLVCGMGIQFAGPAASLALLHLTPDLEYARSLAKYVGPLCTLGMLLTWSYAVAYVAKPAPVPDAGGKVSDLAEAYVREA